MAKDIYHDIVREAIEKDGWTITNDPYRLAILGRDAQIDLGAEKMMIAADKGVERIAIEIKSFINPSFTYDFHLALGQYLNYILLLEEQDAERELYLAVSQEVYDTNFHHLAVEKAIQRYNLKIVVFDSENLTIISWIK
jgi:hypothetical protein